LAWLVAAATPAIAQPASLSFTAAQAEAGKQAYTANCAACHGDALEGVRYGPPLKGLSFTEHWAGKPVRELYEYTATKMPEENPGTLPPETYAAVLAYVLQQNGVAAADVALAPNMPPNWVVPPLRP
jgi:mono/diheme cytochrome c family protein